MPRAVEPDFREAAIADAAELAALHTAVAIDLTDRHGRGPWSMRTSESGSLRAIRTSNVCVATIGSEIVASFALTTRKPWAIDPRYFAPSQRPLYLLSMAVLPARQRHGLGTLAFREAVRLATAFPGDAIRLDAYDSPAGAGGFYVKCGCVDLGGGVYRRNPLRYFEYRLT